MITKSISIDKETWNSARERAQKEHLSLSGVIRELLKQWLSGSLGGIIYQTYEIRDNSDKVLEYRAYIIGPSGLYINNAGQGTTRQAAIEDARKKYTHGG